MQQTVNEAEVTVTKLVNERNGLMVQLEDEKRKCEDLLFRFEEESVNKDDIQVCTLISTYQAYTYMYSYDYLSNMIKPEYLIKILGTLGKYLPMLHLSICFIYLITIMSQRFLFLLLQ